MVIIGAKGFGKEVLEILHQNKYDLDKVSFFDNISNDLPESLYNKFPILRSENAVKEFFERVESTFVLGIGGPLNRYKLASMFAKLGGNLMSIISPQSNIGNFGVRIGDGVNLMTGTTVTNDVEIGTGSLINLHCTIGHDSILGEFVELSPGVHVSGNCTIGDFCNIGTNAVLLPKITLGENVIVGAGAVVTKDVPPNSLVVGLPAKVVKELSPIFRKNL